MDTTATRETVAATAGKGFEHFMTEPMPELLWVYVCKGFTGYYPVGVAAVAVAKSQQHAAEILNAQLRLQGLKGDATADMMTLVTQKSPEVVILCDGNY